MGNITNELSEIISNQCAAPSIYRMGIVLGQLSTRFRTFQKLPRLINMRHGGHKKMSDDEATYRTFHRLPRLSSLTWELITGLVAHMFSLISMM